MADFAVIQGVDYSFDHPTPAQLKAAGKRFACRYVYPYSQNQGTKNLTRAEVDALKVAGIKVVSNYESYAGRAGDGRGAGQADAAAADKQHRACGGSGTRPIFFSVDFDTTISDYVRVDGYFQGVASVIGTARTGCYGEYDLVKHLMDRGLIGKSDSPGKFYAWQTYAWSAGKYDERCCLAQDKNGVKLGDGTVDLDSAHCPDYGQWGYRRPTQKPPVPVLKPVRVDVMHASMQFSDTSQQQRADANAIFARAAERKVWWVTGTEANQAEDSANFAAGAKRYGYNYIRKGGDVWVALGGIAAGRVEREWIKVIPGVAGRHPERGVLRVTFPTKQLGRVTVLVCHYNLARGSGPQDNPKLAREIAAQAVKWGKGTGLVFYGGDQNLKDENVDTFLGGPLTSVWDELKTHPPTHGQQTIDVVATYDRDGRVKAAYGRALDDTKFKLATDHYLVEAGFDVVPLR